jgi:threonine dehydrogenase-like Zn-dependent dehydrogenase
MNYRGVLGHEFVGKVLRSDNSALIGRRVVGEINAGCGRCDACRGGLARHCAGRTVLGIVGRDGAFAERLSLPNSNLHCVPDSVPDELAVFVEPVAAAYEILDQLVIPSENRICVLGDGRMGAIVAFTLAAEGFAVTLGGHHREKLGRLAALGIAAVEERALAPGFDVVVDATGRSEGFNRALQLVRARGTLVLKSTAASSAAMNLAPVVVNEITVVGSRCGRFEPALAALASRKLELRPLISATLPLEDGVRAMELAATAPNFKVLLRPS